jgi:hypothetical protein
MIFAAGSALCQYNFLYQFFVNCFMTEKLLQYIWQFSHFNRTELKTTCGELLQIVHPGQLNDNQGPDFLNAQIKIGDTTFHGSIELHLATSHWSRHNHEKDLNYRNVILHVVYQNDLPAPIADIPVLELQQRIPYILLQQYNKLMLSEGFIPCENSIGLVSTITWTSWKERLLIERLTRKAQGVLERLKLGNNHWEEVFWWLLARNFGGKVNGDAFEAIARTIPLSVLAKHKQSIHQLEALLLGQAGLLNDNFEDDYSSLLQREYRFLAKKYDLKPVHVPVFHLRMRPGNFPAIRLAQLAALIQQSQHLFSKVLEASHPNALMEEFNVTANDFWHYHYTLKQTSPFKKKTVGKTMAENVFINTITTMLFAYGIYNKFDQYMQKALQWLEIIPAEKNSIIKGFSYLNIPIENAFDSQAFIELKTQYCAEKRCLQCAAGNAILKASKKPQT